MAIISEHLALLLKTARTPTSRFSGLREYFSETLKWRHYSYGPLLLAELLNAIGEQTALNIEYLEYDTIDDFSYRVIALMEKQGVHIETVMQLGAEGLPTHLLHYCLEDALTKIRKAEKGSVF